MYERCSHAARNTCVHGPQNISMAGSIMGAGGAAYLQRHSRCASPAIRPRQQDVH
jgi:hypothetical protein